MVLPIVRQPKTPTHCALQLHGQRGSKELASPWGKMRIPLATANYTRPPLRSQCSIPTNGGNAAAVNEQGDDVEPSVFFGRSSFPHGFLFGASSSAYQTEGGVDERGANIWDTFCRDFPDKIADKSNGDVAIDSYHRYMEDVALLKAMGADAYRFSISWPRILRDGTLKGGVNDTGVKYYNKLIDTLLDNGIKPFVTLFHWDVPQALEDDYGGFRDRKIVTDFKDYCEVCYKAFGDRVKHWITLNEPMTFSTIGYGMGLFAPGRCSSNIPEYNYINCPTGDSKTEPYIVAHNLILAHAAAARLYKEKYQATQKGKIGITLNSMWHAPYNNEYDDLQAQGRALDFNIGWFMDPLVNGDYPFNMRALVRDRLPYFEDKESKMIKGSFDFLGLNYYTGTYEKSRRILKSDKPNLYVLDSYAEATEIKDSVPIGDETGTWIYVYPKGMMDLLIYIKSQYHNPPMYITENGMCEVENPKLPLEKALDDPYRKHYISLHLQAVKEAIRAKVDVKGYFHWSLTDNFEWREGYTQRFGLNYIDYKDNLKRIPKTSATWFTNFLKS